MGEVVGGLNGGVHCRRNEVPRHSHSRGGLVLLRGTLQGTLAQHYASMDRCYHSAVIVKLRGLAERLSHLQVYTNGNPYGIAEDIVFSMPCRSRVSESSENAHSVLPVSSQDPSPLFSGRRRLWAGRGRPDRRFPESPPEEGILPPPPPPARFGRLTQ